MATRPSNTSTRSKKSSAASLPPAIELPDETRKEAQTRADNLATDSRAAGGSGIDEVPGNVQITRSKLEQREIPSFSESREARIAESAYWRAERRGFQPGHELEDWLRAENEVDGNASGQ